MRQIEKRTLLFTVKNLLLPLVSVSKLFLGCTISEMYFSQRRKMFKNLHFYDTKSSSKSTLYVPYILLFRLFSKNAFSFLAKIPVCKSAKRQKYHIFHIVHFRKISFAEVFVQFEVFLSASGRPKPLAVQVTVCSQEKKKRTFIQIHSLV